MMKNTGLKWLSVAILLVTTTLYAQPIQIHNHNITLRLRLSDHKICGVDRLSITAVDIPDMTLILNKDFQVHSVKVEGADVNYNILKRVTARDFGLLPDEDESEYYSRAQGIRIDLPNRLTYREVMAVEIAYSGIMYDTVSASEFSRTTVKNQTIGIVGDEGVFLAPSGIYYPTFPEGMSVYRMSTALPKPFECVTQGRRTQRIESQDSIWTVWESVHPADGIYLVAGKYQVGEHPFNDLMIYTFLTAGNTRFASMYVPMIKKYIALYEDIIGQYPYSKFALVENFFETGYGMPSYTLLGPTVMSMPFVMHVSLPHEILHNWWGNGVFVEYKEGNWCEGLTTYMSNYYIKEQEGLDAAKDYRRDVLRDYTSYVDEGNDYPLVDFVTRQEASDRAIGYGKSMMVFHGLRMMVGDESFYEALRFVYREELFKPATWHDFRAAFEWVAGEDLGWYFDQWVYQQGGPKLSLGEVNHTIEGPMVKVTAEISQSEPLFRMQVPVVINTETETFRSLFNITQEHQVITMEVDGTPTSLAVDPDFDVFRRLDVMELPPTVARVYGDKELLVVLPSNAEEWILSSYQEVANLLIRTGDATTVTDAQLTKKQIKNHSLFLLGSTRENTAYDKLKLAEDRFQLSPVGIMVSETRYVAPDMAVAVVTDHPEGSDKVVAFLFGSTPDAIENAGSKLPHYGKYSWVTFQGTERWERGTWEAANSPLKYDF